jgi:pimeloyl-ACP methyl ester carboxylesterase
MREMEIDRGGRVLRVRDAGDRDGAVVVYVHGSLTSRLDVAFGDELAAGRGVRLVSFDRPGYGGSTPAPFGLASIGADVHAIADGLGVAQFAVLGVSGGGPGALAAAAVPGGRVVRVGIAPGTVPFGLLAGAPDDLDDNDRAALALLPGDPAAAAAAFAAGFEPLVELSRKPGNSGLLAAFEDVFSSRDQELLKDQRVAATWADSLREGLRQGTSGAGWDYVSFFGEIDIDLSAVRCPVLMWYGTDDRLVPLARGVWLAGCLPGARLVVRDGEGHLGLFEHLGEMLDALAGAGTTDPASAG